MLTNKANHWFMFNIACIVLAFAGCATTAPPYPAKQLQNIHNINAQSAACRKALEIVQALTTQYHRNDAGEQKIKHFPYLRTDRFLAALSKSNLDAAQRQHLFYLLEQTGSIAMQNEFHNLPIAQRQQIQQSINETIPGNNAAKTIDLCSEYLAETELKSRQVGDFATSQLHVDDNYKTWQRIVGLYYITLFPVRWGINDWHDDVMKVFSTPVAELPVQGTLQRYGLNETGTTLTREETQNILALSANNPLRIPLPDASQRQKLVTTFAPVWEIDTVTDDDRIGTPNWKSLSADAPDIDTSNPVMYTKLSHVLFQGEVLIQINYMIWFPSRPCQSSFDILCGNIDGLIWRVTLSNNGTPLLFDSIHSCGCYHQFFPTPSLKAKQSSTWLQEPVLIPKKLPAIAPTDRLAIRIATVSHYIDAVTVESTSSSSPVNAIVVPHQRYDVLRSIPINDQQRRSLFDRTGLVPGTQRAERFILWPMGVPSPGAMRQWGTHATAFVGRRHFDDPCLIETIFESGNVSTINDNALPGRDEHIYSDVCKAHQAGFDDPDNQ